MTKGEEGLEDLKNWLKKDGTFLQKENLSQLLQDTKDVTVQQMVDHNDCGGADCKVCSMKTEIDSGAYKRGVEGGIMLRTKFPKFDFGVSS